jgi:spore coat protein A
MRFDVVKREAHDVKIPSRLCDPGHLERPKNASIGKWEFRLSFSFGEGPPPTVWTINGKRFDPDRIDAKVQLGETELWRFRNEVSVPTAGSLLWLAHTMHTCTWRIC